MQRNKIEMFLFILVITFILFSHQLDPLITILVTGILLALIFFYRSRSEKAKASPKKSAKSQSSPTQKKHKNISK